MSDKDEDREIRTLLGMLGFPMIDELSAFTDRNRTVKSLKHLLRDPVGFAKYRASDDFPREPEWADSPFSVPLAVLEDTRSVIPEIRKPAEERFANHMLSMASNTRTGALRSPGRVVPKPPKKVAQQIPQPSKKSARVGQFAAKALKQARATPRFVSEMGEQLTEQGGRGIIGRAMADPLDIDLSRPKLTNPDGTFSTEETITVSADGLHYLIPTIIDGVRVQPHMAVIAWKAGVNPAVGAYKTAREAARAAVERSKRIGELRGAQ